MSWSTGKDSAYALAQLLGNETYDVAGLFTTVTRDYERVAMHGVRQELLQRQAELLGLPLFPVYITKDCTYETYEEEMRRLIAQAQSHHVTAMVFGDLFLDDVRQYRVRMLEGSGIEPLFPLWHYDTHDLAHSIIQSGIKAMVTCVDLAQLPQDFVGKPYDDAFLNALPAQVDKCGENGEFHTFVYESPLFREPIPITLGEFVVREGFGFADVLPEINSAQCKLYT
nr:arCOG00187: arCOG00187 universal archaeal metal-binding-domain/4Fe-4S-binding-domain containing ABC transporter, ATP-binding protein [uncultured bacterium]